MESTPVRPGSTGLAPTDVGAYQSHRGIEVRSLFTLFARDESLACHQPAKWRKRLFCLKGLPLNTV